MSQTTRQFKDQLPKNAVMAVLSFVTYSISAAWLTPYLYKNLGAVAYGLVPLAGLFTQYASIITSQISGSVNRFLVIELQKPDGNPNAVFNVSFALCMILVMLQLPIFGLGLYYADHIFTIPRALLSDALLLLGCSAVSFMVNLFCPVFSVSLYAKNRLDIGASISVGRLSVRLLLIVLCFSVLGPKLRYIGYVDLLLNIVSLLISIGFWRKFTPGLHISMREIDWKLLLPIFRMSFWTLFNSLGAMLYLRTDILIINRFISPVAAGQYAAVLVVANFIRQIGMMFSTQFGPVSMSYWAKGELNEMGRLLRLAMKVIALVLAVPVAFLCLNGASVLGLWLGPEFSDHGWLLVVMCIHLPINVAVFPLLQLQTVSNSVQLPAMVTFSMGVLNVVVSYILGVSLGYGVIGVAVATAVVLTIKNALFTPCHAAYVLKRPLATFIKPLYSGVIMLTMVWVVSFGIVGLFPSLSGGEWVHLLFGILVSTTAGTMGWFLLVAKGERRILYSLLPGKVKRYFNA